MKEKHRNYQVDVFRGVAMLLVVIGHTISNCTKDYESSMILNIIWTLQMPLFFIISGYVTQYSKRITCIKELGTLILKKSGAYLMPWITWTFLIQGFIMNQKNFFNIKYLLWHMDTGYWFLVTIWIITIFFGCSQYFAKKFNKVNKLGRDVILTTFFMSIGSGILLLIGRILGVSFLGIKLTLYYIPFFMGGYVFSVFYKQYKSRQWLEQVCSMVIAVSAIIYVTLLTRYNFYVSGDGISEVVFRATASITGCITVIGLSRKIFPENIMYWLRWVGIHTLEIYLIHHIFLTIIISEKITLMSIGGIAISLLNFVLTMLLSVLVICMIQKNQILNRLLFWKRKL